MEPSLPRTAMYAQSCADPRRSVLESQAGRAAPREVTISTDGLVASTTASEKHCAPTPAVHKASASSWDASEPRASEKASEPKAHGEKASHLKDEDQGVSLPGCSSPQKLYGLDASGDSRASRGETAGSATSSSVVMQGHTPSSPDAWTDRQAVTPSSCVPPALELPLLSQKSDIFTQLGETT